MKRRLFPGEREIRSIGSLTLTNHRVILYAKGCNLEDSTSLLLDHVQWTRLVSAPRLWSPKIVAIMAGLALLVVAGLAYAAVYSGTLWPVALCLCILAVIVGLCHGPWYASLVVGSGSGRIRFRVGPGLWSRRQARDFLDDVERAAGLTGRHRSVVSGMVSVDALASTG